MYLIFRWYVYAADNKKCMRFRLLWGNFLLHNKTTIVIINCFRMTHQIRERIMKISQYLDFDIITTSCYGLSVINKKRTTGPEEKVICGKRVLVFCMMTFFFLIYEFIWILKTKNCVRFFSSRLSLCLFFFWIYYENVKQKRFYVRLVLI